MMFEVYKQTIEIKDKEGNKTPYEIKPLSGRYLPKLYSVVSSLSGKDNIVEDLSEDTIKKLHELALETMTASYPTEDKDKLDLWVSQNLIQLIEGIVKVNIGSVDKE